MQKSRASRPVFCFPKLPMLALQQSGGGVCRDEPGMAHPTLGWHIWYGAYTVWEGFINFWGLHGMWIISAGCELVRGTDRPNRGWNRVIGDLQH